MLKHTPHEHPDTPLLIQALATTQEVAVKINDNEKRALQQEHQQDILRDLENVIEGLEGLVQPERLVVGAVSLSASFTSADGCKQP